MPAAEESTTLGACGRARVFLLRPIRCFDGFVEFFFSAIGDTTEDVAGAWLCNIVRSLTRRVRGPSLLYPERRRIGLSLPICHL
jgi:hypothetical protein